VVTHQPSTIAETAEIVREAKRLRFLDEHPFRRPSPIDVDRLDLAKQDQILDVSPADQVVVVSAGRRLDSIQTELAQYGQTLPWSPFPGDSAAQSVGTAISLNLPHLGMAAYKSWREWVLGLTVIQADGAIVHCGSRAVKNVAGYDVQRLLVGSRGAFGVVVEVILRTFPLAAFEPVAAPVERCNLIQRTLPADFESARREMGERVTTVDQASSILYGTGDPVSARSGWYLRAGSYRITDQTQCKLTRLAKSIFDPTWKLNPDEVELAA
jgi:glycolate oxidase FAD binding subunit